MMVKEAEQQCRVRRLPHARPDDMPYPPILMPSAPPATSLQLRVGPACIRAGPARTSAEPGVSRKQAPLVRRRPRDRETYLVYRHESQKQQQATVWFVVQIFVEKGNTASIFFENLKRFKSFKVSSWNRRYFRIFKRALGLLTLWAKTSLKICLFVILLSAWTATFGRHFYSTSSHYHL